ncbi:MAG: putative toxin-antitoxin system toxin component, PIN family [Neisseriaceae bacterium]|nr:putative toxin-antitoxin system toxin component, PIN family [Neisseriaceae bacterium]MBR1819500.1 putative toxin-antitoxin system toxin component, PIN family [Neisseriaceae bacterium]
MKIILDTNILVAACMGSKPANTIVAQCLQGLYQPIVGTTLLNEYETVLLREEIFVNCRLNTTEREELLNIFLASCQWVQIYYAWRPNLIDEGDNHLIELAVAGNARYLITRNVRDFHNAQLNFPQLAIRTPENFLQEIFQ